jgi:NADH:ubiquinone oxidoreductase subunit F (NADH-binding)
MRPRAELAAGPRPAAQPGAGELPRLLPAGFADGPASLAGHLARYGPPPVPPDGHAGRMALMREVERAGLTGRGGAHFPTARKLAAVAAGTAPVVVANGTEGEPASAKDQILLARAPHLVLDGAALAASLTGARDVYLVVHHSVADIVAGAAQERGRGGRGGPRFRVVTAAERFVAGEASAVVNWIERGVAAPLPRPPRLAERGLGGRPTLVQNVETLAHLALIGRYGAGWFRTLGTPDEPGTMLVTILGAVREPCVTEVAIGTPLQEVLDLAGGASRPLQALLVGGYSGSWVGLDALTRPFSTAGLRPLDAGIGAGLIAALPADACGLAETARVTRYLAGESAGQCGPCLFGLDAIAGELERLASGYPASLATLHRWLGQVAGRGACAHPDGVARLAGSALRVFAAEAEQHAQGWCGGTDRTHVLPVPPGRPR